MPKLLIDTFEKIVLEYFEKVKSTEFIQPTISYMQDNPNIIFIGLNTIIHIFRITLIKYKNTDIAYHYSKQGYYYFLEYIQQLSTANFQHHLNINDAITFVYTKTLSISLDVLNNHQNVNLGNSGFILNNLTNITNTLLRQNGSHTLGIDVIQTHLSKILHLFSIKKNEKYVDYLFEITSIDHLDAFYKNIKKLNKSLSDYDITCKILEYKQNSLVFIPL